MQNSGFKELVESSWKEVRIESWGSYVVKEKLKRLKETLKEWNKEQFGNLDQKMLELREELKVLDERDDVRGLLVDEGVRRNEVMAQLLLQLKNRKSLLALKAKMK